MIQIETKTPQIYDARDRKQGKIILRLETEKTPHGLEAKVIDFAEKYTNTGVPYLWQISEKKLFIPPEKLDALFAIASTKIPKDTPFLERDEAILRVAFLIYIQNDEVEDGKLIYNTQKTDWKITE